MAERLTDEEAARLLLTLDAEVTVFAYTIAMKPEDWLERQVEAVREVHRKVMRFEGRRTP